MIQILNDATEEEIAIITTVIQSRKKVSKDKLIKSSIWLLSERIHHNNLRSWDNNSQSNWKLSSKNY